ncbi:MAG: putative porin [Rikenellaceae bacterium]
MSLIKTTNRFTLPLLALVAAVWCVSLFGGQTYAQTAAEIIAAQNEAGGLNNLNANPYDDGSSDMEEGQEQNQKERKPRKPKKPPESFFFSDSVRAMPNFKWNISKDFNRVELQKIDTTLNDWRIDYPYQKQGLGDMTLGGLGQATQPLNFYDRSSNFDFEFAQVYNAYIYTVENAPFYNVKKPFTLFSYAEAGQKSYREANFEIIHTQNVSPSTAFTIEYRSESTRGQYQRQDTKNHNFAATASHNGRRYSLHTGFLNNSIDTEESGGVVGIWAVRDSIFDLPSGIPTKLENAEASNKYRNNTFFVKQAYGVPMQRFGEEHFSLAERSAFYIGHSFEYSIWKKIYQDIRASYTNAKGDIDEDGNYISTTEYFYDNWFLNADSTRDSIRERVISNRFFVQLQPWDRNGIIGTIDGGVGIDNYAYSQFGLNSYLTGDHDVAKRTSWFAYGSVEGYFKKYLSWGTHLKFYPSGYRGGDTEFDANLGLTAFIRQKPINLSGKFSYRLQSPTYWQENLISNHFVFNEALRKEGEVKFDVKLEVPVVNLEIGAMQRTVTDMIYYGEDMNIAQHDGAVTVMSLYGRKKFQFKGVNLDHRVLAQWSSDQSIAPVPTISALLSYYYEFWAVKDVLRMQVGIDGRFTTSYTMPSYNPAISAFYNQTTESLGNYPYLDAYIGAKWKRMRILVKYQHLNMNLFGNNEYFSVANYPLNPSMFKLGLSWGFYD